MSKYSLTAMLFLTFGTVLAGCTSDIGETCATKGSQDECVQNAVCDTTSSSNEPICLKVCTDAKDCAADEDCNGTSGSNLKSCHPKTK